MKRKIGLQVLLVFLSVLFVALPFTYLYANEIGVSIAQLQVVDTGRPQVPGTGGEVDPPGPSIVTPPNEEGTSGNEGVSQEDAAHKNEQDRLGFLPQAGENKAPLTCLIGLELLIAAGMIWILKRKFH